MKWQYIVLFSIILSITYVWSMENVRFPEVQYTTYAITEGGGLEGDFVENAGASDQLRVTVIRALYGQLLGYHDLIISLFFIMPLTLNYLFTKIITFKRG